MNAKSRRFSESQRSQRKIITLNSLRALRISIIIGTLRALRLKTSTDLREDRIFNFQFLHISFKNANN